MKDKDVDCDDFMNPTLPCTAPVLQILSRNGGGFFLGLLGLLSGLWSAMVETGFS